MRPWLLPISTIFSPGLRVPSKGRVNTLPPLEHYGDLRLGAEGLGCLLTEVGARLGYKLECLHLFVW